MSLQADIPAILRAEYASVVGRKRKERQAHLESLLAGTPEEVAARWVGGGDARLHSMGSGGLQLYVLRPWLRNVTAHAPMHPCTHAPMHPCASGLSLGSSPGWMGGRRGAGSSWSSGSCVSCSSRAF